VDATADSTWLIALQSRDIVATAKIGSGKTLGYLILAFIHFKRCGNNSKMGPTALVLSPTRELATQVQGEALKFGNFLRMFVWRSTEGSSTQRH